MTRNIKTLRQFAKLKKYPAFIQFESFNKDEVAQLLQAADEYEIDNERTVARRVKNQPLKFDEEASPFGVTYHHKYVTEQFAALNQLEEQLGELQDIRFAILESDALIPRHLDDPAFLNIIITLYGNHTMYFDHTSIEMKPGDVYMINTAYYHAVQNHNEERVALLMKVNVNDNNLNILRS